MIATLELMGKKYTGEGDTALFAIESIPYKGFARTKALLTIGEKTVVMPPMLAVRLFSSNPNMRKLALKNISLRFT